MTSQPFTDPDDSSPDLELKEMLAAEQDAGDDFSNLACWDAPDQQPPSILRIRIVDLHEPIIGLRARYWMTSYDSGGQLVAIGWRDGLRVVSQAVDLRGTDNRIVEPGVYLMEEGDWYRQLAGPQELPRFHAGQSRTWVDLVLSNRMQPRERRQPDTSDQWLSDVLVPPAVQRLAAARPARDVPNLVGRRVLCLDEDGFAERDLRAISEPALAITGDIVASVMDEADWYLWRDRSYNEFHPSMRTVPVGTLWVEM